MIATVTGISMNESNVPILIVVAVLLAIGVVLLLQRISAKHRSDPAKRTLQTEMVPSSLTDTPRDPTQDKTSIERMLKGETQRRDESVSRPTASARDDPATEQTLRKSKPPIRALMVGRWELAYIQSEDGALRPRPSNPRASWVIARWQDAVGSSRLLAAVVLLL